MDAFIHDNTQPIINSIIAHTSPPRIDDGNPITGRVRGGATPIGAINAQDWAVKVHRLKQDIRIDLAGGNEFVKMTAKVQEFLEGAGCPITGDLTTLKLTQLVWFALSLTHEVSDGIAKRQGPYLCEFEEEHGTYNDTTKTVTKKSREDIDARAAANLKRRAKHLEAIQHAMRS